MMTAVLSDSRLQGLRRFTLATMDAHALYAQFGFKALGMPQTFMERYAPDVYEGASGTSS